MRIEIYVRHYLHLTENMDLSFEDHPFLEISPTRRVTKEIKFEQDKTLIAKQNVEEFETPISQYNKKAMCDYILSRGEYASQKLLKLAVSYRFAYSYYSGNPEVNNASHENIANDEEFRLIYEMICCIVKEYNYLRKELKMDYSDSELETGIPQL